jgi:hypothetical protein
MKHKPLEGELQQYFGMGGRGDITPAIATWCAVVDMAV